MKKIKTLKELVYYADEKYGEKTFITEHIREQIRSSSFHMFRNDCDAVAAWLEETFKSKIHAALIGDTSYKYLTAWLGIQCCANVSVPLDTSNKAERIADEINRSDCEVVFLDSNHTGDVEVFKRLCPSVKQYISIFEKTENTLFLDDILKKYHGKKPQKTPSEDELSAILFTSGTTGKSKGVMLSHGNLIDNTTCEPDDSCHGEKKMTVLPVHHIFCFTCDILCSLWFGRTVCVNDSLMRLSKNMKLFQPNTVTFVPMIALSLINKIEALYQKTSDRKAAAGEVLGNELYAIFTGGAYLSPDIQKRYKKFGIDISQGYGMTECSPRICSGKMNTPFPESVGKIVPGCEVRIDDGEICVKSRSVMMGYYKNPEETAKAFTEDGWLRTGDLGYKNESGYLFLTGRKKNLIILSNGENVSPEELENQFSGSPRIKEIIVYAKNDRITAEIYPDPEYKANDIKSDIRAEVDRVNDTFPPSKRIVSIVFRDKEFEKTASRKIIRPSF